jgi:peptidoglycan hydrolase-like protein with peptidoglycan-binding domain
MSGPDDALVVLRNLPNTIMLGAKLELDGVFDYGEAAYHEAVKELDFKGLPLTHEDVVVLRYSLRGRVHDLRISVEYDPSSKVHAEFYGRYAELRAPEAAVLFAGRQQPGVYELKWDGRDATPDKRILLAGDYTLKIRAETSLGPFEKTTKLKVAPPRGWNFALHTVKQKTRRGRDGTPRVHVDTETAVAEVTHALQGQQTLLDGTRFATEMTSTVGARQAAERIGHSAVAYFGAHSAPIGLVFENKQDGSEPSWLGLVMLQSPNAPIGVDTVSLKELPKDAFRDVLLLVLAGCRSGNSVYGPQLKLMNHHRNIDPKAVNGVLDQPTQHAIRRYQRMVGQPETGRIDDALLTSLGVGPAGPLDSAGTIRVVQGTLAVLSDMLKPDVDKKGEVSGIWGASSQLAMITYQNKVGLRPSGYPDPATLDHMGMGPDDAIQESVAQTFLERGVDTVLAFEDFTLFGPAEQWSGAFWGGLSEGKTVVQAAKDATASLAPEHQKAHTVRIYPPEGVSSRCTRLAMDAEFPGEVGVLARGPLEPALRMDGVQRRRAPSSRGAGPRGSLLAGRHGHGRAPDPRCQPSPVACRVCPSGGRCEPDFRSGIGRCRERAPGSPLPHPTRACLWGVLV